MAKCDICGKGVTFGIKVSHSHRRANRAWKPNVKRVKAIVDGTPRHVYVCTRCLRSNKVERAICSGQAERASRKACYFFVRGYTPGAPLVKEPRDAAHPVAFPYEGKVARRKP